MFNTLDSQPQEWLLNDPARLHTVCVCCFQDSAHARRWIHALVPRNQNGRLVKWSGDARRADRARRRRLTFIEAVERVYDEIDFVAQCVSSTEAEISEFTQLFYTWNQALITQEADDRGNNCLVFRIDAEKTVKVPVLRAARLVWVYFVLKYMKEVHRMSGFTYSDWFAGDNLRGEDPALGVGLVNFLLGATGIDLRLSIAKQPQASEADMLSDWFAGWANSSKSGTVDQAIAESFDAVMRREPSKIDWIRYKCAMKVTVRPD